MALALDTWQWLPGQTKANRIGPNIASAATVAPTHPVHHVTGTTAIVTITPPSPDFSGDVTFIADAIWTWTAAGNIGIAGTVTAAGKQVKFVYDPGINKWYPDKVA